VWVKKCVKMCVMLFKMLKSVFKLSYQTRPYISLPKPPFKEYMFVREVQLSFYMY